MKLTRTIKIQKGDGLTIGVTIKYQNRGNLVRDEHNRVFETLTDNIAEACSRPLPYHSIHRSNVTIKG